MTDLPFSLAPLTPEDCDELARVHNAVWRATYAGLMPDAYLAALDDELVDAVVGTRDASLWVADGNDRAVAFYTRRGFVADGARTAHDGTGAPELRMVRRS